MRIDATLAFVPLGSNLSLVAAAGVNISSNVLDALGQGVGTPPANIIGKASLFGTDFGVGGDKQVIQVNLASTPAITTANAATLNIALQAAPDTAGTNQPGTWQTIGETGAMTLAQLVAAQTGNNQQPIRLEWPPNFPQNLDPRYFKLLFQVAAATNFTAGLIAGAFVTRVRDDYSIKFQPNNYTVA